MRTTSALLALTCCAGLACAQPSLTIIAPTGTGDAFTVPYSDGWAISGDGSTAVGAMITPATAANNSPFFFLTADNSVFNPGVSGTRLIGDYRGVNENGTLMVGRQQGTSIVDGPGLVAIRNLLTNAVTSVVLNDLPGGTVVGATAYDVSDEFPAKVVGFTTPNGLATPSFWRVNNASVTGALPPVTLTMPSAFSLARALSISGNGETIVGFLNNGTSFAWVNENGGAGTAALLPDLAGGADNAQALGISRDGSTIVGFGTDDEGAKGVYWKKVGGVWTPTAVAAGVTFAAASADGSVIVGSRTSDALGIIWTAGAGVQTIGEALSAAGFVLIPGLALGEASGVSSNGEWIVGEAQDNNVTPPTAPLDRAFVARIPRGPAACGPSDVAGSGQTLGADGQLTADDIIVFIGWFFAADARADVAGSGQTVGADGQFTADDIIIFINRFFAGC